MGNVQCYWSIWTSRLETVRNPCMSSIVIFQLGSGVSSFLIACNFLHVFPFHQQNIASSSHRNWIVVTLMWIESFLCSLSVFTGWRGRRKTVFIFSHMTLRLNLPSKRPTLHAYTTRKTLNTRKSSGCDGTSVYLVAQSTTSRPQKYITIHRQREHVHLI